MPLSLRPLIALTLLLLTVAFGMSGCGDKGPVFVDEGTNYTTSNIERLLDVADISQLEKRPTTEAPALRHSALSGLRRQGKAAADVADLLTSTFEPDTRGVPVYVERASFEGARVVIVIEATGPRTGTLKLKRLWALGADGSVILTRGR